MTKRQRNVKQITNQLRPLAVFCACVPLLFITMFTGCGILDGEKHMGRVRVQASWEFNSYQLTRENGEVFRVNFASGTAPSLYTGVVYEDIVYRERAKDVREFVKAVTHDQKALASDAEKCTTEVREKVTYYICGSTDHAYSSYSTWTTTGR